MLVGHFIIFISPFFAGHHISARWQLSQVLTEDCNVFLVIRVLLTNTDHGHSLHITNTHNNARGLCRCVVTFTTHLNGRIHSVCCAMSMSMMYKYLCFLRPAPELTCVHNKFPFVFCKSSQFLQDYS